MSVLVLIDDGCGDFGPLTDLRPVFDLASGALTTRQRLHRLAARSCDALFVPPHLAAIMRQRTTLPVNELPPNATAPDVLIINGRCLHAAAMRQAMSLPIGSALVQGDGQRVALRVLVADLPGWREVKVNAITLSQRALAERPWHLMAELEQNLLFDLGAFDLPELRSGAAGLSVVNGHPIRVASSAKLHPMVVLNAEKGPIVIDDGAVIGSFAVLGGPCYVGPHSIVTPHTHVRAGTSIGPHCVAGGEISASVLAGCSNKAHAGYLGNSYVGHWVNLGAETTVSNLKNTYGSVRVQLSPTAPAQDSGLLKLGPIIGDFVRTAIGSRLLTGSCIGTATMLAVSGFAPKSAARFRFITDDGEQRYDVDKLLATAAAMTARRSQSLSPAEVQRLRELAAGD